MLIISNQTYRFKRNGKEDVIVSPSPRPQSAPDDVAEDPLFGLACSDNSITVVEIKSADPDIAPGPAKPPKSRK